MGNFTPLKPISDGAKPFFEGGAKIYHGTLFCRNSIEAITFAEKAGRQPYFKHRCFKEPDLHLLYYISAHGYGHAARSCAIGNRIPRAIRLTIRTALPPGFFADELKRPFDFHPAQFDCGCAQRDGVTADVEATLRNYQAIAHRNTQLLKKEAAWCRDQGVDGIISDIAPFPFDVAATIGIPSVAASNFTWHDIYAPYTDRFPWFGPCLDAIDAQYQRAGLLLAFCPANSMTSFPHRVDVPVVGKTGVCRAEGIRAHFNIAPEKKCGLIYIGNYGLNAVHWERLELLRDWEFFGLHPLPAQPANYHLVTKEIFSYQDLTASMDCLIAKVGYGIYADAILNGLPLLHLPRPDFAEYPVLARGLQEWGGAYCLEPEAFCALDWTAALDRLTSRARPRPVAARGAALCADHIVDFVKKSVGNNPGA
jgi:hypothetical protein